MNLISYMLEWKFEFKQFILKKINSNFGFRFNWIEKNKMKTSEKNIKNLFMNMLLEKKKKTSKKS